MPRKVDVLASDDLEKRRWLWNALGRLSVQERREVMEYATRSVSDKWLKCKVTSGGDWSVGHVYWDLIFLEYHGLVNLDWLCSRVAARIS